MRRLFVAAVAAAGLAGALAHDSHALSGRKTLSFDPVLPHATEHINPVYHSSLLRTNDDSFEVARLFVEDLVGSLPDSSFGTTRTLIPPLVSPISMSASTSAALR